MWWPAIGGLVIGLGGLIFPQALGRRLRHHRRAAAGRCAAQLILGILLVKSVIWAVSLGSGTSGGVLAPLLMMGGALGGMEAMFLPHEGAGFWPLVSMGAILGGTMRSPFTGVIFALELTHDVNMLLPLLLAVTIAHGFTVLTLRRSILTEKVARRGYHLSREYCGGSAGDSVRARSHAHQYRRLPRRDQRWRNWLRRSTPTTSARASYFTPWWMTNSVWWALYPQ